MSDPEVSGQADSLRQVERAPAAQGEDPTSSVPSLRQHCEDGHDLRPESTLDEKWLENWHLSDHTVIKSHDLTDLGYRRLQPSLIDLQTKHANPAKALAERYRALRLDRQSVAMRGGPASLIESLTLDMISAADALMVEVLKS